MEEESAFVFPFLPFRDTRACHALSGNKAALELVSKFTEKERGRNYFERYHI